MSTSSSPPPALEGRACLDRPEGSSLVWGSPEADPGPEPILWLTDDSLFHYQRCHRRAFLDLYGDRHRRDPPSDYLLKLRQDSLHHQEQVWQSFPSGDRPQFPAGDWRQGAAATLALMAAGVEVIQRGVLLAPSGDPSVELVSQPDLLIKREGWSCWGNWHYVPIDIKLGKKPKLDYQLITTYHAYLLSAVQGVWPAHSYLALRDGKLYGVEVERLTLSLQALIRRCGEKLRAPSPPELFISHSRCDLCPWLSRCYTEARAINHLSLLPGVTPARYDLLKQHQRVSLTDLAQADPGQLAHWPGFGEQVAEKLVHQAQSWLQDQAMPRSAPGAPHGFPLWPEDLPSGEVELFFDIEAAPDQNLIYLHGVLVVNHRTGVETFHALLAETHHHQHRVWQEFLELVHSYPYAPIYHFCPYEAQTVRKLGQLYGTPRRQIDQLLDRFFDVHRSVTESVTLPIESYALKHIARWMGFNWRDEGANGAQSICWYNAWVETGDRSYLEAILRYNEDDCRATYQVKRWLTEFAEPYWQQLYQRSSGV